MKKLSVCFWVLAALLSDLTCAVAAWNVCDMSWGIRYAGYSAPVWTGLLPAIPYALGAAVCVVLALVCKKKAA